MIKFAVHISICFVLIEIAVGNLIRHKRKLNRCDVQSECVPFHLCLNETINTDGYNLINPRIDELPNGDDNLCNELEVCCRKSNGVKLEQYHCGRRYLNIGKTDPNASKFGEFPWMVAILRRNLNLDRFVFQCGGSLIHPKVILTAAHCVHLYIGEVDKLKIRTGVWDTQAKAELLPYQDRGINKVILHEQFHLGPLHNDIALMILSVSVKLTKHINTICLGSPSDFKTSETNCFATGWGKDSFGSVGRYQMVLKKQQLPIVASERCQTMLRQTILGRHFQLHYSFICAGGENGKDMCRGDGGSPLICEVPNEPNQYYQSGIVAWGIGCGENGVPGVYVNVPMFSEWIRTTLQYELIELTQESTVYLT